MITKGKIEKLAKEYMQDTALFLVDMTVSSDNQIQVYIDGDNGVAIDDCVDLSRHIEFSLDREEEDFALNVSSAGADMPLRFIRQYAKYVNEKFNLKLTNGEKIFGRLQAVLEDSIEITPLKLNPNIKKGVPKKFIEGESKILGLEQIEESKLEITF
jgi:ribosome maturation factor RimP